MIDAPELQNFITADVSITELQSAIDIAVDHIKLYTGESTLPDTKFIDGQITRYVKCYLSYDGVKASSYPGYSYTWENDLDMIAGERRPSLIGKPSWDKVNAVTT